MWTTKKMMFGGGMFVVLQSIISFQSWKLSQMSYFPPTFKEPFPSGLWNIFSRNKEFRNYARKRKQFVYFQSRKARVRWASAVQDWQVAEWKDMVFSDKYRYGLKNDWKTLWVWHTKQEAFSSRHSNVPLLWCSGGVLGLLVLVNW